MHMRRQYFCVLVGLYAAGPAAAEQWFTVSAADAQAHGTVIEVDLDTVRLRPQTGEAVIRATFDAPQRHQSGFGFRSFTATIQLDCQRRSISLNSAAYYALPSAGGARVGADSSGREAGMPPDLIDKIPGPARQAILKATCTPTQN